MRVIDSFRQTAVWCDLRALHPTQRIDLPQTLTYQVVAESSHRAQRRVNRRLRSKAGARRNVLRDRLGPDLFNHDPGTPLLQPSSPAIQPSLCVHRLPAQSPRPVLLHVCVLQTIPSPHRCPPKRSCQRASARPQKHYENKQYDLRYDSLGGRDGA